MIITLTSKNLCVFNNNFRMELRKEMHRGNQIVVVVQPQGFHPCLLSLMIVQQLLTFLLDPQR